MRAARRAFASVRSPLVGLAIGTAAIGACTGTEPAVPRTITLNPASIQFGAIGSTTQLTATVKDENGKTMPDVAVSWATNQASVATVSPTGLVTAAGNGTTQIVASTGQITAAAPVTVAQTSFQLIKVGGDGQTGTVGTQLPLALEARLTDSLGNAIPNVAVTFVVTPGSGSVSAPSVITNASGVASVAWTLGTSTNAVQRVTASAIGLPVVVFSATPRAGAPASVVAQAGDSQVAAPNTALPVRPAVLVRDQFANPVPNHTVTFAAASGGGSVTGATALTTSVGIATVGAWTLGGSPGPNSLTATAAGSGVAGNSVTFTARAATPGPPASVLVRVGDGQTGLAGFALNVPPAVEVRDSANIPVPNAEVTFAVAAGGGSVSGATAITDGRGVAVVGSWTVQLGANGLTATVTGSGIIGNPVTFTATGVISSYHIELRYLTPISASRRAVFDSAAARWERLLYNEEPDITLTPSNPRCTSDAPTLDETIDDMLMFVKLDSIDGPAGILGRAGLCYLRISNNHPIVGIMVFDTADVAMLEQLSQFDHLILHEMGHLVGFGTLWNSNYLNADGGTDPHFIGGQALAAFDRIGGTGYTAGAKVPVENIGGSGTRYVHWRESVFGPEAMTGFINEGVSQPLSVVSVASMGDLGYQVNYAGADAFSLPYAAAQLDAGAQAGRIAIEDDVLRLPVYVVDRQGKVMRVYRP